MGFRRNIALLASAAILSGQGVAAQGPAADHAHHAAKPQCLGLPEQKVAVQTYNFAAGLAGVTFPAEWDGLPVTAKFQQAMPMFAKMFGGQQPKPTREQIGSVLKAIHDIGFRNVEGFDLISQGSPELYAALLKENGLQAVANHTELNPAQWPERLAEAKARGQTFVGSSGFGKPGFDTLEHTLETARNLNALGKAAEAQGLKFYVHNHDKELTTQFLYDKGDGKPVMTSAWEIVAANTDPKLVHFEVDVFWALAAYKPDHFKDLTAFLEKYRSRIVMLHIKDLAANGAMAAPGKGVIDWRQVVAAAGPQIAYYIVEYDLPSDAAKVSKDGFTYLTCNR
jgi:sugar phosphate isomerase/epimerase